MAVPNLKRVLARIFMWRNIIRSFRGLTLTSQLNLFVSALIDIFASFFVKQGNPVLLFSGVYLSSEGLIIFVRGRTDDLYHLVPGREGDVDILIRHLLRPGDVFVDVGANVGYYTLLAAKKGCSVVAVEPVPQTVAVLRANIRLNQLEDRVIIIEKCAWSSKGSVSLVIPRGTFYGLASAFLNKGEGITIKAECTDLDEVLLNYSGLRIIKIDAEGAEYEVLKGANDALRKTDFVLIEISQNIREVIIFLMKKMYGIRRLKFTTYVLAYNVARVSEESCTWVTSHR